MPQDHLAVGIVVERRSIESAWADHAWAPVAVLPEPPPLEPWSVLPAPAGRRRYYLGETTLTLHAVDTAHFAENFADGRAKIWVAVRPTGIEPALELVGATVDPTEGEVFLENAGDIVEALPMPAAVAERVLAFYGAHHVEREFVKRKRHEHDPRKGPPPGERGPR